MVLSSYLVLQLIHLALLVRVGGVFLEDFIMGSLNLNLGAPRFSGYLQNRRSWPTVLLLSLAIVVSSYLVSLRGLQDSNCNLTTPDFLAAGPA